MPRTRRETLKTTEAVPVGNRRYAVDYHPKEATNLIEFSGEKLQPLTLPATSRRDRADDEDEGTQATDARVRFTQGLKPGDEVYLFAGGGADNFALAAYHQGASVFRLPYHRIGAPGRIKGSEALNKLIEVARSQPDLFYPYRDLDLRIAEVMLLGRSYRLHVQGDLRKPWTQRAAAARQDLYLIEAIGKADVEQSILDGLYRKAFKPVEAIVDQAPKDWLKKKQKSGQYKDGRLDIGALFELNFLILEDQYKAQITRRLNRMAIHEAVFAPIMGLGPVPSAMLIGAIKDIRWFPSWSHLKSYFGLNFDARGRRRARMKGDVANWNQVAKVELFLFGRQIAKYGKADWKYRTMYDQRRLYETEKLAVQLSIVLDHFARLEGELSADRIQELLRVARYVWLVDPLPKESQTLLRLAVKEVFDQLIGIDPELPAKSNGRDLSYLRQLGRHERYLATARQFIMSGVKADTCQPRLVQKAMRYIAQKVCKEIYRRWHAHIAGVEYQEFDSDPSWMVEVGDWQALYRIEKVKEEAAADEAFENLIERGEIPDPDEVLLEDAA